MPLLACALGFIIQCVHIIIKENMFSSTNTISRKTTTCIRGNDVTRYLGRGGGVVYTDCSYRDGTACRSGSGRMICKQYQNTHML